MTTGLSAAVLVGFARSFALASCFGFAAGLLPIGPATELVTDPAAGRRSVGTAEFKQSGGGSSSALALGKICAIEFKQGEGGSAAPNRILIECGCGRTAAKMNAPRRSRAVDGI